MILTVIPGSLGLALLLQIGALKLILWALRPPVRANESRVGVTHPLLAH